VRSWFAIPAVGLVCGGAAIALGLSPAIGLTGAALAAVVRALAGDSPAALAGAAIAPVLAVASFAEAGDPGLRAALALAAAGWAIAELSRAPGAAPPFVAALPAVAAAVLDPSFAALVAIAGARAIIAPGPRPRWALAVLAAGAVAIAVAIVAGTRWPALAVPWFGRAAHPVALRTLVAITGEALGPITAVAALGGLVALARSLGGDLADLVPRVRWLPGFGATVGPETAGFARSALAAAVAGAVLVDLRAGAPGHATLGLAAALSGLAIVRLARMIRLPSGQAIAAATIGALVVVPPVWTVIELRATAAHIGHASR
jgi:hypothetical protein